MVDLPFIQVNMIEGRSPEKKEKLIYELTNIVCEVLEAPRETVRILINEMPSEHWGIAGESVKRREEKVGG